MTKSKRLARLLRLPTAMGLHSFPIILCLPWLVIVGPLFLLPYFPFPARILVQVEEPLRDPEYDEILRVMQRALGALYDDRESPRRR